jgi:hypothetical protein
MMSFMMVRVEWNAVRLRFRLGMGERGAAIASSLQHAAPRREAFECRRIGAVLASAHGLIANEVPFE